MDLPESGASLDVQNPIAVNCGPVVQALVVKVGKDGQDELLTNGGPGQRIQRYRVRADGAARGEDLPIMGGRSFACADLDRDDRLDLVVAGKHPDQSIIYWGDASGIVQIVALELRLQRLGRLHCRSQQRWPPGRDPRAGDE